MNFTPKFEEPADTRFEYPPITDYMTKEVITFHPHQSIKEAMESMLDNQISGAPVVDDSANIVGMLSETDCLHILLENAYNNLPQRGQLVEDYMSQSVTTISADKNVVDVAYMFLNSKFRRYPVVDKGRLIGQVSRKDIMKAALNFKSERWR
ncbi:CBS domain-containing protein [Limibacter armeniacum]|uniref:CBS domain-containing protein n=1 Tax=Limibacter armeniacum TaxID=466084 RepID=UPI002FE62F75